MPPHRRASAWCAVSPRATTTGRRARTCYTIYDTGTTRLLIDRTAGQPTRQLATLTPSTAGQPGDSLAQITAICEEYVRHHRRTGGPLAWRLTTEHLTPQGSAPPAAADAPPSATPLRHIGRDSARAA